MKSILIVDDELDIANNLSAILETEGYKVVTRSNGREALEHLKDSRPDAVLLDIMMPLVGGLDVLRHMRKTPGLKDVPVILMSVVRPLVKQSDYGWQVFLQKPFTLTALFNALHELIGEPSEAPR